MRQNAKGLVAQYKDCLSNIRGIKVTKDTQHFAYPSAYDNAKFVAGMTFGLEKDLSS